MSKLREQSRKHGVVHLPNALDPDTLKVAERIWENTLDQPGPGASRLYRERLMFTKNLKSASELPQNGETGLFYQELGNLKVQNLMESLVVRDAITSIIHEIFDSNKAWFSGHQVFLKEKQTPATGWHQDISDINAYGDDLAVLWMSFDHVPQEGGLEVIRGSHTGPVYNSIYGTYRSQPVPKIENNRDAYDIFRCECFPGDLILFHYGSLHGGGATADFRRRSMALRFTGPNVFEGRRNAKKGSITINRSGQFPLPVTSAIKSSL